MKIKYLVNKQLIPDDGSEKILEMLEKRVKYKHSRVIVFPDIHYKKGSRVINGMLYYSDKYILPSALGVENCGFTVGRLLGNNSKEEIYNSFQKYAEKQKYRKRHTVNEIKRLFKVYLKEDFENKKELYHYLGLYDLKSLYRIVEKCLTDNFLNLAIKSIGTIGSGNHFFEIHQIIETKDSLNFPVGQKICIVHSDSIEVGDYINILFSNLSEWDIFSNQKGIKKRRYDFRKQQIQFFTKNRIIFSDLKNMLSLLYSQKDYRLLEAASPIGKQLIFYHNLASVFGEINRDMIMDEWSSLSQISFEKIFSHSHDSISVESHNGQTFIVQRNGVQYLNKDNFYVLPGALGTITYILKNTKNEDAFLSANHGTGRIKDKHIANKYYTNMETVNEIRDKNIKLYRVGKGNIAEQNFRAFKDVNSVVKEMQRQNLGIIVAKTTPLTVIKG